MLLALLIALLSWILGLFLPWWSLAISCLILGAWLGKKGTSSFAYGFLGIGMLWLIQSMVTHIGNDGILTERIADLFSLPHYSLVILVTVIIGGLAGGLSSMTGYFAKKAFSNQLD